MAGYSGIIRRFAVKGIAKTPVRLKEDWDHLLLTEMKELGYAQLLDLEPYFSTNYDHEKDWYEFSMLYMESGSGWRKPQNAPG